tara:strand:+ start:336 stop:521 length:186 start_codon:yes stop_codon:yes gene_type:complete
MALVDIVSAIIKVKKSLMTIARLINGERGLNDVYSSLLCIASKDDAFILPGIQLSDLEKNN